MGSSKSEIGNQILRYPKEFYFLGLDLQRSVRIDKISNELHTVSISQYVNLVHRQHMLDRFDEGCQKLIHLNTGSKTLLAYVYYFKLCSI